MGRDAYVHIDKKYSKNMIEDLLLMMGFEKCYKDMYYLGNDKEYKYLSGIQACFLDDKKEEHILHIRTQSYASSYDIHDQNQIIKKLKRYCNAWFEGDCGRNRYFEEMPLVKGAENGCYFAIEKLHNSFVILELSLSKYPEDLKGEKMMMEFTGVPTPQIFNANVYSAFLCSLIEEYFRSTYIALLRYSNKKEKILNVKFSSYDMCDISEGKKSVEEVFASTLSFQNIHKIVSNFKGLDNKLDIGSPLKKPYNRRKLSLYNQIDNILERRHGMIHRMEFDYKYSSDQIFKDIKDVKVAMVRVYSYICKKYGWEEQIKFLI